MIYYKFDESGRFQYAQEAELSPVTNEPILPRLATWTPPPEPLPNHYVAWTGQQWDQIPIPQEPISAINERIRVERANAYRNEADPLFFKAQRNEDGITIEDWQAKIAEIRARYPYVE
jgi:hypothetical protein